MYSSVRKVNHEAPCWLGTFFNTILSREGLTEQVQLKPNIWNLLYTQQKWELSYSSLSISVKTEKHTF